MRRLRKSLINTIKDVVNSKDPNKALSELTIGLSACLVNRSSSKHMAGRYLGRQESSYTIIYDNVDDYWNSD